MGALTAQDAVWYADGTDLGAIDVITATMAQSISDGIGTRLRKQENLVGAKLGISGTVPSTTSRAIVPFSNIGVSEGFVSGYTAASGTTPASGIQLSGGTLTFWTPGQYLVSAQLGFMPNTTYSSNRSGVCWVYHNGTIIAYAEAAMSGIYSASVGPAPQLVNVLAGDTIFVQSSVGYGQTDGITLNNAAYITYFSVALIKAS